MTEKKNFGQYFTPRYMAEFMLDLSETSNSAKVLEPSSGEGVFLKLLKERGYKDISAYEIDPELAIMDECVHCESFIGASINGGFDLAIGNPPYIRWKNLPDKFKLELENNELWQKHFNALCDYSCIFMLKSVELLKEGGELIFICPEYWMNTTHSEPLRRYFLEKGYFSDFYIFNEAPIFKGATVSSVVFRFVKSSKQNRPKMRVVKFLRKTKIDCDLLRKLRSRKSLDDVEYLELPQFHIGERWVFADSDEIRRLEQLEQNCTDNTSGLLFTSNKTTTIGDVCDIGNGMVSGLDKAFQIPENMKLSADESAASILVYKAKNIDKYFTGKPTRYIYVPENITEEYIFKSKYPHFYELLKPLEQDLNNRYQYGKNLPYWQWCFKRNEHLFAKKAPRLLVPCKERISAKSYVRFALADSGFYPTQDVTALLKKDGTLESIEYILAYLNHPLVFNWIKHYGIIKGNIVEFSEKPLASIPFRKIKWDNKTEVTRHDEITALVQKLLQSHNVTIIDEINLRLEELLQ